MSPTRPVDLQSVAASLVLVVAAALFVVGAAIGFLAPSLRESPPFVTEYGRDVANAISGNPIAWQWANGLILFASISSAIGLLLLAFQFRGQGRQWAFAGLLVFTFGAVFESVSRLISMYATTWAAQRYPDDTAQVIHDVLSGLRLGDAFVVLAFIALGVFGLAYLRSGRASLGWAFVVVGSLGLVVELVGAAIPFFVFLGTAALGVTAWRFEDRLAPTPTTQEP